MAELISSGPHAYAFFLCFFIKGHEEEKRNDAHG